QMLAAIALCVATTVIVKSGRARYVWVTALPLAWLVVVTTSAAWQKLFSDVPRIGLLAHAADLEQRLAAGLLSREMAAQVPQLLFNDRVNMALTALFLVLAWVLVIETCRVCLRHVRGKPTPPFTEEPYVATALAGE